MTVFGKNVVNQSCDFRILPKCWPVAKCPVGTGMLAHGEGGQHNFEQLKDLKH